MPKTDEVVDAVDGQVEGGEARRKETAPPPVVVLEGRSMNQDKPLKKAHLCT
jgi:hypothetical protein